MTLSQIMRASRWEDVRRYVKNFDIQADRLTLSLYEKMFNEMQQINPEGEGFCIQLHRCNNDFLVQLHHPYRANIKVSPPRQLLRYMWPRYLGAEVKDMGETKRKYIPGNSKENTTKTAESSPMPDAAMAANMLYHLSGHGYSQAEVENNIKRHLADRDMGYYVRYIHQLKEKMDDIVQLLESKTLDAKLVDDFLNDDDYRTRYDDIIYFTTYFSTLYAWSHRCYSETSEHFRYITSRYQSDRSLMVIAYPPSYELSEEAISTIQHYLNAPNLRKTIFVKDESLTDRIRIEVFVGTYF